MIIVILILLGLCFGSFINALIWRIHEQDKTKSKANKKDLSIVRGRSMCPQCRHALSFWDLVPVVNWIALKGKCRYCSSPISWQYPTVEMLTALFFVISYLWWTLGFDVRGTTLFIGWLALLVGLVALAVYDLRWMLLPNRLVYPLLAIAIGLVLVDTVILREGWEAIQKALLGATFGGGLFYLLFQVSDGRWIGGGDVKLGFLLGIIVGGPINALLVIFVASLLGSLMGMLLMVTKRLPAKSRIPFGPFLISAAIFVRLLGPSFINWYQITFLLV